MRLEKLKSQFGRIVFDSDFKQDVFHVDNQHIFVQASGYLKYCFGQDANSMVLYRGQSKLYPNLRPSLYREVNSQKNKNQQDLNLNTFISQLSDKKYGLKDVNPYAIEPLLQHYGIRTKWLDLVDNIWIALWFACNEAISAGVSNEYLHFEQRIPYGSKNYAYVLLIKAETNERYDICPGVWKGPNTELIDLRTAVHSLFLRPHVQHAMCCDGQI